MRLGTTALLNPTDPNAPAAFAVPAQLDGKVESFSAKVSRTPTKKSANAAHDYHEFGESSSPFCRCLKVVPMISVTATGVTFFDPLPEPWHRNRAAGWALAISLFLHALAITFLPGLRIVQPQPKVLTVALAPKPAQQHAHAPAVTEKPAAAPQATAQPKAVPQPKSVPQAKPAPKQPTTKATVQKPFQRQDLEPTIAPSQAPQPVRAEPRPRLAPAPSAEPNLTPTPEAAPPTIARADPRPLPQSQIAPLPRSAPAPDLRSTQRAEPNMQPHEENRPEPKAPSQVESRPLAPEPRVLARPEPRIESVPTPRNESVPPPEQRASTPALPQSRPEPNVLPKIEPPRVAARTETRTEVKAQPRAEPAVTAKAPSTPEAAPPDPAACHSASGVGAGAAR